MPEWISRRLLQPNGKYERHTYPVYTRAEADAEGISYIAPDDVTEPGQHVLSEDGYVAPVLRISKQYTPKKNPKAKVREVRLPYCRYWMPSRRKLEYLPFKEKKVYCSTAPVRHIIAEMRRTRFKKALKRYAFLVITQQGVLSEEQMKEIGRSYRPDQAKPEATFKRMLKNHEVKKMLKSELRKLMDDYGVTPGHVIRQQQEIIDMAKNAGQLGVAEKANGRFIEMLGMMPDDGGKVSTQITAGVSWGHLGEPEEPAELVEHEEVTHEG